MSELQAGKGQAFKDLHSGDGIFVMPNAWNAGSACMLEEAGFPAVGTTSAGIAFCLGLPDYEGALSRDAALEETGRIAGALRIPVSVDAENGYGHTPEEVAETIRRVADTGAGWEPVSKTMQPLMARAVFTVGSCRWRGSRLQQPPPLPLRFRSP